MPVKAVGMAFPLSINDARVFRSSPVDGSLEMGNVDAIDVFGVDGRWRGGYCEEPRSGEKGAGRDAVESHELLLLRCARMWGAAYERTRVLGVISLLE
jgi:hypothetical protein